MTITESQLDTWSKRPDPGPSAATYQRIRSVLEGAWQLAGRSVEIYLQGSYGNDTNTRADSDVDVVAELTSTFHSDTTNLPPGDLARYQSDRIPATYHWDEYLEDVIDALRDAFGASAVDTSGNKSIKVARAAGRLPVDVVPAMHYRRYYQYPATGSPRYVEGIRFLTRRERRAVINYPKLHIANGQTKNKSTPEYKASVRMIKNARRVACDLGLVPTDAAPSYFLECLLYNAPDELFTTVRSTSYLELLSWALDAVIEERALVCGNGIVPLFGASPEQWDRGDAMATLSGLVKLWREL